jgi:hypothetical protein
VSTYPLTLTVEYEERDFDPADFTWSDEPHGFAVIKLNGREVHREPMTRGSSYDTGRDELEEIAAEWLAKVSEAVTDAH